MLYIALGISSYIDWTQNIVILLKDIFVVKF